MFVKRKEKHKKWAQSLLLKSSYPSTLHGEEINPSPCDPHHRHQGHEVERQGHLGDQEINFFLSNTSLHHIQRSR